MNEIEAIRILAGIAAARKKWGKNASLRAINADMLQEAIVAVTPRLMEGVGVGELKEMRAELAKLRRSLAVCLNREKARTAGKTKKVTAVSVDDGV